MDWLLYSSNLRLVSVILGVLLSYGLIKAFKSFIRLFTSTGAYLQFDRFTDKEVIFKRDDGREWIAVTFYSKPQILDRMILSKIWRLSPCTLEIRKHQSEIELFLTIFTDKEIYKQRITKASFWFEKLSGDIKILKDRELRNYYQGLTSITLKNKLTLLDDGRSIFGVISQSQENNLDELSPTLDIRSMYFFSKKNMQQSSDHTEEVFRGSITQVGIKKDSKESSISIIPKFLSFIDSLEFKNPESTKITAMRFRIPPYGLGVHSIEEGIHRIERLVNKYLYTPQSSLKISSPEKVKTSDRKRLVEEKVATENPKRLIMNLKSQNSSQNNNKQKNPIKPKKRPSNASTSHKLSDFGKKSQKNELKRLKINFKNQGILCKSCDASSFLSTLNDQICTEHLKNMFTYLSNVKVKDELVRNARFGFDYLLRTIQRDNPKISPTGIRCIVNGCLSQRFFSLPHSIKGINYSEIENKVKILYKENIESYDDNNSIPTIENTVCGQCSYQKESDTCKMIKEEVEIAWRTFWKDELFPQEKNNLLGEASSIPTDSLIETLSTEPIEQGLKLCILRHFLSEGIVDITPTDKPKIIATLKRWSKDLSESNDQSRTSVLIRNLRFHSTCSLASN